MLEVDLAFDRPIRLSSKFSCDAHETFAIVGPSGSGKSTLLHAIAGLLPAVTGRVTAGGESWLDSARGIQLPAHKRHIGYVFQSYALFPHLSVEQNIRLAMSGRNGTKEPHAVSQLLATVNLAGFEKRMPDSLSGGQRQRVAVARALARSPSVLLLDEPFSAVDHSTRSRLYEELASLRAKLSIPVVLVTHSLPEAIMLSQQMVVLHQGMTLQVGPTRSIISRPSSVEVARLVGYRNLLRCKVIAIDETGWHLRWGEQSLCLPESLVTPGMNVGDNVVWAVPNDAPRLKAEQFQSTGKGVAELFGTVQGISHLGDISTVTVSNETWGQALVLSVPERTLRRAGVEEGGSLAVRIGAAGALLAA